jgi:hypothetical protein
MKNNNINGWLSQWEGYENGWPRLKDYVNWVSVNPKDNKLDYSGSRWYGDKVQPDDKVFIHVSFPGLGRCLLGRIVVAEVMDTTEAEKRRGYVWKGKNGKKPRYHIVAKKGTIDPYLLIPINKVLPKLTWIDYTGKVRRIGKLKGSQQFRSMRKLTSQTVGKLERLIEDEIAFAKSPQPSGNE